MDPLIERIMNMLEGIPDDDAPVVLPKRWVLQLIAVITKDSQLILGPEPLEGYTVKQVAAAMQRSRYYVWGLVRAGEFPGAYLRSPREYRIPLAAIEEFLRGRRGTPVEREATGPTTNLRRHMARRRARKEKPV